MQCISKVKLIDSELVWVKTCEKSVTVDNGKEFAEYQYIFGESIVIIIFQPSTLHGVSVFIRT